MVYDGQVNGTNYKHQVPNLNRNQKGVPGLQKAFSKSDGKAPVHTTTSGDGQKVFIYRGSKASGSSVAISSHLDPKSGVVDYSWVDYSNPNYPVRTLAIDKDNDGNIDTFTTKKFNNKGKLISQGTYVNQNDDGSDNFQLVQPKQKSKFSWNPLNWFK